MKLRLVPSLLFFGLAFAAHAKSKIDPRVEALDPDKFTVCSASINSTLEREVAKAELDSGKNKGQFQFVELTELGTPQGHPGGVVSDWFDRACKSGVKCDILIISAHYSSTGFFSEKTNPSKFRYPLRTSVTTRHACEKTCDGILGNQVESFLMACNGLASKNTDHRTPGMYLEILKKDGVYRSKAERAVEDRYGDLGPSNAEQTRFTFAGVNRIVGFKSTSALAENSSEYLRAYFRKFGDYGKHLQVDTATRLSENLVGFNQANAGKSITSNAGQSITKVDVAKVKGVAAAGSLTIGSMGAALTQAFPHTSICVQSGVYPEDSLQAKLWKNICALRDSNTPVLERLKLVKSLLQQPERAKYVPDINEFMSHAVFRDKSEFHATTLPEDISPEIRKELEEISRMEEPKKFIELQIEKKKDLPTLRKKLIYLAKAFQWMTPEVADKKVQEAQAQIDADPDWPTEFDE